MKIEIKCWRKGFVLFEGDFSSVADCLRTAVKRDANLQGADLQGAYLRGANLRDANLQGANLQGADLEGANLQGADLQRAYLQGAYLQGANLQGAYLQGATNADLVIASTRILPEGDLIGWKNCCNKVLVKLLIPAKAKRSHAFGRKCRAEFVKVLEIVGAKEAVSIYTNTCVYRVGEIVKCDKWNDDYTVECGGGIHFFITRLEAENYDP